MALTPEELKKVTAQLKAQAELQRKLNEDTGAYAQLIKDIKNLHKDIAQSRKRISEQEAESTKATKAYNDAINSTNKITQTQYNLLKKNKELEEAKLGILKDEVKVLEDLTVQLTKQAKESTNIRNIFSSVRKDIVGITKTVKEGYGKFKAWSGTFEMDKAIRMSATQMGILNKQTNSFRDSLDYAGQQTASFGVGIGELAKLQSDYSEELGRTVMLGQTGLEAMAAMSKATGLGAEGAAKMAADMEQQGISAERTSKFVEETMNDSSKMGLNASKVIKNIANNMKLLNKYNFKGGVVGLTKMSKIVTKLGVDMTFVTNMADKLFDVEGAVDMSAQLQVMGGAWAKLADPFKLMYMARNDMAGLTEELGKAAEASVTFNKTSGKFEISSMEMHKLRKVAEQTGVAYDELAQAGKNARKATEIKRQMNFSVDDETKEFLATTAKFTDKGEAYITVKGETVLLKTLNSTNKEVIKAAISEKASLKERAEASQTFDEKLTNIVMQLKQYLLPFVNKLDNTLRPIVDKMTGVISNPKFLDGIKTFAEMAGKAIGVVGNFIANNPIKSLIAVGLFEGAKWIANGVALGMGFNSVANAGGGMSGMLGKIGGIGGGAGTFGKFGKMSGGSSLGGSLTKGLKVGGGLGLAGLAMNGGRSMMDNPESGAGKALGIGGTAAGWAGTGAMIGSVIPGLGTAAGGIIGGVAGAGKGIYDEYFSDEAKKNSQQNINSTKGVHDGSFSKGRGIIQGGKITPIDNKDDLMAMKPNGPVDKAIKGNSMNGGTLKIEFGEIHFKFDELKVTSPGSPGVSIDLLKDPMFIRSITRMVHSETEKVINGGMNKG